MLSSEADILDIWFFFIKKKRGILWSYLFLLAKVKPEYSDILYNPTHFPGSVVCLIKTGSTVVTKTVLRTHTH
jgi:hypothetical protein